MQLPIDLPSPPCTNPLKQPSLRLAAHANMSIPLGEIDYNDPAAFLQMLGAMHLPIPQVVSPAEVRRQAGERRDVVLSSYKTLGDLLSRHEATIQKRWAKKSRTARTKILLECWPNMAKAHRADFAVFREGEQSRTTAERRREAYMWPYINLESLASPRPFLVLLNARGRNHPSQFACADIESIHLGVVTKEIVPLFLNEHTMMLNGVQDDKYGQLLNWDDHPDAFLWMFEQRQFNPGEGLLVLECQERILTFLVACCKVLLHDIPPQKLLSDDYPPQPMPELQPPAETDALDSQALMREEELYRLPARLDMKRISSVLQAQADAAADHCWLLREDPGYFADELLDVQNHQPPTLRNSTSTARSLTLRQETPWPRIVETTLVQAYTDLETFAELSRQAALLAPLVEKRTPKQASEELPQELLMATLHFRQHLVKAAEALCKVLATEYPGSPPMRDFVQGRRTYKAMSEEEFYFDYLMTNLRDDKQVFLFRLPLLIDEIDRRIGSVRHFISPRVANVIGRLSVIAQCLREIDQYHPWARSYEMKENEHGEELRREYSRWYSSLDKLNKDIHAASTELGRLSSGPKIRFDYPSDKRRSKETVEAMRLAEQQLDTFWSAADSLLANSLSNLNESASASLSGRDLQRTSPWVEPSAKAMPAPIVPAINEQLAKLDLDSSHKPSPSLPPSAQPKAKVKTRGIARDPGTTTMNAEQPAVVATPPAQQIGVDARALKTFRNLFFNPDVSATPGEIPWKDFRHATAMAGYEPHKLYGSAWQFQSPASTIIFHEPHPNPKIPIWQARRIGRRLSRAFGWDVSTFVLKDKLDR